MSNHSTTAEASWEQMGVIKGKAAELQGRARELAGRRADLQARSKPAMERYNEAERTLATVKRELDGKSKHRIGVPVRPRRALLPNWRPESASTLEAKRAAAEAEIKSATGAKARLEALRLSEALATLAEDRRLRDQLIALDDRRHEQAVKRLQTFVADLESQLDGLRREAEAASEPLRTLEAEIGRLQAEAADCEEQARRMEADLLGIDLDAEQNNNPVVGELAAAMI